jgi:DNA gyrase subunit A
MIEEVSQNIEDRVSLKILEQEMQSSYLKYAMSVIVSRALPDVRDGLKPVHRRIIYTMHRLGLTPGSKYMKSARVVGDVLGKYHPHGDLSVYNAMVRMAQEFSLRYPLVDGQGNFGSIDGDSAAAYRYTEARLAKPASYLIQDIDKDTVDFADNYDGSTKEPTVLPNLLPNLLLNGVTGIAVGMATNIPPHNAGELIGAIKAMINNRDITIDEILEYVKGPDLPTGGIMIYQDTLKDAYRTGLGRVTIKSRAVIEDDRIIINEIPYEVNKADTLMKIAELIKDKKLDGIRDIRDESNKDGIRVVIELKRDSVPEVVLNNIFKQTDLQKNISFNMLALVNRGRQPKLLNIKEILEAFVDHRSEVVTRRTKFDLAIAEADLHIQLGLKIALDFIDEVVALIRSSKDKIEAAGKLIKRFKLSDKQAEAILMMRLQTLTGLDKNKILDKIAELEKAIKALKLIIEDKEVFKQLLLDELTVLEEKLPKGRRTEIDYNASIDYSNEDLIPNDQVYLQFTNEQYFKILDVNDFRSQGRGGKGVISFNAKDSDQVIYSSVCNMHDHIFAFTNFGRVYKDRVFGMPQGSRVGRGQNLINYFKLQAGEKITVLFTLTKEEMDLNEGHLVFALNDGQIKKSKLSEYKTVNQSGKIAVKLGDDQELINVALSTSEDDNIVLVGSNGRCVIMKSSKLNSKGRVSGGVKGIKLGAKDKLINMQISRFEFLEGDEEEQETLIEEENVAPKFPALICVSANGFAKMTYLGLYRIVGRGSKGVITYKQTAKTGQLVFAQIVYGDEESLLITTRKGISIKTPFDTVSHLGRNSLGKKMIKTEKNDDVATASVFK